MAASRGMRFIAESWKNLFREFAEWLQEDHKEYQEIQKEELESAQKEAKNIGKLYSSMHDQHIVHLRKLLMMSKKYTEEIKEYVPPLEKLLTAAQRGVVQVGDAAAALKRDLYNESEIGIEKGLALVAEKGVILEADAEKTAAKIDKISCSIDSALIHNVI